MKLVDNVKDAWRWFSMRAMFLSMSLQGAWMYMTDEQRASFNPGFVQGLSITLLALGMIGRLVKQGDKTP